MYNILYNVLYKCWCYWEKKTTLLITFRATRIFAITRKMKHWSWISVLIKRSTQCFLHPEAGWVERLEGTLQYCVCIGINIAWSSSHHLSGFLTDITPQHHGNMYADGYWIQIWERPDIQQLLLQLSGRGSGWTTHRKTTEQTHILVSAVFGHFSSVQYPQQKDHKAVYET